MMKIKLLAGLLLLTLNATSQNIESYGKTYRLNASGFIGKDFKIYMALDFIPRVSYVDGCVTKVFYQISGQYYYEKYGGSITLVGEFTDWSLNGEESDSLVIFELNENFEKVAFFWCDPLHLSGVLRKFFVGGSDTEAILDTFEGNWINIKTNRKLPFIIKTGSTYSHSKRLF